MRRFVAIAAAVGLACAFGPKARGPASPRDPAEPCEPEDCGPAPPTSPYLCTDGMVNGATGRCLREGATCRWELHRCTDLVACGIAGVSCPAGYQCVDDPRDDCDPSEQRSGCPGLCLRR